MFHAFRRRLLALALLLALGVVGDQLAVALLSSGPSYAPASVSFTSASAPGDERELPRAHAPAVTTPIRQPRVVPAPQASARPAVHRALRHRAARPSAPKPFTLAMATQRGKAALASLRRAPAAGWTVRFEVYQGRYLGLTDSGTKLLTLWVKPTDGQQELRITLAHELGHILDFTTVGAEQRSTYLQLRHRSDNTAPWYPCNGCEDYAFASGDFAEVYALWLAGPGDFRSRFAAVPDAASLKEIGSFFTSLG